MPELPDLVHLVRVLGPALEGRTVVRAAVKEPIVLRVLLPGDFRELLPGLVFRGLERRGPFLRFHLERAASGPSGGSLPASDRSRYREVVPGDESRNRGTISRDQIESSGFDLIMHLMLAGRLRIAPAGTKPLAYTAFSLELDSGEVLSYGDEKKMGKIYLCETGSFESIPGYLTQGVDVTSEAFTWDCFSALIAKKRCQARVFVMDQSALSAIGNAYADEILFEAGIHPKATACTLPSEKKRALYDAIKTVLAWGVTEVEAAGAPLEDKVRGHMRVRNRAGEKCPRCGATIRRAGVLGYDAFFCPVCQPDTAGKGLDWTKLPKT
jgi:formamidopyrimidine-DNA glycosylase